MCGYRLEDFNDVHGGATGWAQRPVPGAVVLGPRLGGVLCFGFSGFICNVEQRVDLGQVHGALAIGEQAVVPDAMQTAR